MKIILLFVACVLAGLQAGAQSNTEVLKKMLHFDEEHPLNPADTFETNVYTKYTINVVKRNAMLAAVPTLFYLLRDRKRFYFSESYSHITYSNGKSSTHRYLHLSTVYHRHNTLPSMVKYLTPRIYSQKLFEDGILSPINFHNRKYYRYRMRRNGDGTSYINIRSKFRNTQLIRRGYVIVNDTTGQVLQFNFEGEFDMIHSSLTGSMCTNPRLLKMPDSCDVQAKLSFMGNKLLVHYACIYNLPTVLPDNLYDSRDHALMDSVRPVPLTEKEKEIAETSPNPRDTFPGPSKGGEMETSPDPSKGGEVDSTKLNIEKVAQDSTKDSTNEVASISPPLEGSGEVTLGSGEVSGSVSPKRRRNWAKYIFWDIIGDNMLNRIKTDLGEENQGQLRIGPLFNPFYFGYSGRKGVVYRFDLRGFYNFSATNSINLRFKLGYSFKQKQAYFRIPAQWNFYKPRNGYVEFEFGNGNRISNSRVLENIKAVHNVDSINWDEMHLDYFRDMRLHVGVNYDVIKDHLGLELGFTKHRRSAVDGSGFRAAGRPTVYKTFAPFVQLQYRPLTDKVPLVITGQWEHGVKHFGGQIAYDRFEFDGQYVQMLSRMRNWQLRTGFGFYTHKGHDDYFLDYHNFKEDYISLGWEDEWSGEFEMLNSNWYNASDYYIRANATYESPLLLLSFCPLVGQIVEKERIYISTLVVRRLLPYVELGYGFTNRIFSMGIFTGFSHMGFEGVGFKFGFELFNNY